VKKKSYDIALLLVVLVLFSASLGVLHGRKNSSPGGLSVADDVARIILSKEDALDYLDRLIIGGNVDTIARVLHQFDDVMLFETLDALLSDQARSLTPEQKIQLILACIVHDPTREKQNIFIVKLVDLFPEYPVLYYALDFYNAAIPPIIEWAQRTYRPQTLRRWARYSIDKLIDEGKIEGLKSLMAYGIRPTKKRASELLRRVVLSSLSPEFVDVLVNELGANPNFRVDKQHTILMAAVDNNDLPMVQALLKVGADPELILDPAVGSAKQLSFQKGYNDIDLLFSSTKNGSADKSTRSNNNVPAHKN